jgi:hypothetical protein
MSVVSLCGRKSCQLAGVSARLGAAFPEAGYMRPKARFIKARLISR